MKRAAIETNKAATDRTNDAHPLFSLAALWRRLTSISVRNQSPVCGFHPDQCSANCSSVMACNCLVVKEGFEDIITPLYLREIRRRLEKSGWRKAAENKADLSEIGLMLAVDLPNLLDFVELNFKVPNNQAHRTRAVE